MYYLLDLERSIRTERLHYWKKNKHGYTTIVEEAGLFSVDDAVHIANADMDNYTVMIDKTVVDKLLS
jgi:hypothetical protein